jgi:hypothetical protein
MPDAIAARVTQLYAARRPPVLLLERVVDPACGHLLVGERFAPQTSSAVTRGRIEEGASLNRDATDFTSLNLGNRVCGLPPCILPASGGRRGLD